MNNVNKINNLKYSPLIIQTSIKKIYRTNYFFSKSEIAINLPLKLTWRIFHQIEYFKQWIIWKKRDEKRWSNERTRGILIMKTAHTQKPIFPQRCPPPDS